MVLFKLVCGFFSNLKCLENVLYYNIYWVLKVKENVYFYWCISCRKKRINDENYII